ncbi:hypothetical protein NXW78_28365 [Bacteroides ovatus]|nr:hypothetical protein [Bacteroides ovatus]
MAIPKTGESYRRIHIICQHLKSHQLKFIPTESAITFSVKVLYGIKPYIITFIRDCLKPFVKTPDSPQEVRNTDFVNQSLILFFPIVL